MSWFKIELQRQDDTWEDSGIRLNGTRDDANELAGTLCEVHPYGLFPARPWRVVSANMTDWDIAAQDFLKTVQGIFPETKELKKEGDDA